jgi:hypothetical protein
MSIQLQGRVHALEIENRRMREQIEEMLAVMALVAGSVPEKGNGEIPGPTEIGATDHEVAKDGNGKYGAAHHANPPPLYAPRQMCPKCFQKPNYWLHVKYCKGKNAN